MMMMTIDRQAVKQLAGWDGEKCGFSELKLPELTEIRIFFSCPGTN
jgi:hypothetical protein